LASTLSHPMAIPSASPRPEILRDVCVVLVRTAGPVNLGMVARLCGNFGITDLRLVAPMTEVDCDDACKFSVNAKPLLLAAPIFPDIRSAVADCGVVVGTSARLRDGQFGEPLVPAQLPPVLAARPAGRWALVFGNESDGLTEDEMRACQIFVRLRHFGEVFSYNLAHAVGILLYALAESAPVAPRPELPQGAPRADVDRFYRYWRHTLERFGYFRRTDVDRFAPKLEHLMGRMHLSTYDLQLLWSMFAQFNYHAFGNRSEPGFDLGTDETALSAESPASDHRGAEDTEGHRGEP